VKRCSGHLDDERWWDGSRWRGEGGETGVRGGVEGGWASHIEEARPYVEGTPHAGAEHHPEVCDICGGEEGKEDVIAYVCASEVDATEGQSFEGGRIETKIVLSYGEERAVIDTGAYSVWVSRETFAAAQGYGLQYGGLHAKGVDGTPIEVVGEGRMDFELWGRKFMGTPVRIMSHMQSKVLLGRIFLLENKVVLDLRAGHGSLVSGGITHKGCIVSRNVEGNGAEHVALVSEDVTAAIEGMDLAERTKKR
jgi:hypothetical protein